MAAGFLRVMIVLWLVLAFVFRHCTTAWRLDVSTTPRAIEKDIGLPVTFFCNIRNMARPSQYLFWVFLDADSVQDQLVSSETTIQDSYRDRFTVSLATIGVGRVRYGLSINRLTKEDDGTYRCQVMDVFTHNIVQYSAVSVSVLYFPDPPECVPYGRFFVMAHSLVKMSCRSQSGNPTVNMRITRTVNGLNTSPVVPPPTAVGRPSANWTFYENDDTIVRDLTVEMSSRYTASSFPCTISSPSPLISGQSSSCVMGPIYVVPVPPTSTIRVNIKPPALRVAVGGSAKFTCQLTVSPAVDMARVQKSWSTFPTIDPERLVKRDMNYADTISIRAVEVDDDGLVITCQTVIRGITRKASSRLQVVLPTKPLTTKATTKTITLPTTKTLLVTRKSSATFATRSVVTESSGKDITLVTVKRRQSPNMTKALPVDPDQTLVPTLPTALSKPWYSKPTGIALIVVVVLFIASVIVGVVYVKRYPRKRLTRKVSQKCRSLRYQNVWGSRQATMRREASKRQQVTVSSTHIYHEARVLPDKSGVDSTVNRLSGQPLVVYAETVVNSLYEADEERARTIPCHKNVVPKNSRQKYGNVIGGLGDASRHVTLPNNFMIYGDFSLENTNPYESLIGT